MARRSLRTCMLPGVGVDNKPDRTYTDGHTDLAGLLLW